MATVEEAYALAVQHDQAGRHGVAGEICGRILAVAPAHDPTRRLLGRLHERAARPAPLTIAWPRGVLEYVLETHFTHDVLLGRLGRPLAIRTFNTEEERPLCDNLLTVVFERGHGDALRRARGLGCRNLGILHLADERGNLDLGFYADADYVLRTYHFPHALVPPSGSACRRVVWLPNGYRTGVGPSDPARLLPAADRPMLAFFAGQITGGRPLPEREAMIAAIQAGGVACAVIDTRRFGGGFGPQEYAAHLGRARFAPVPAGNSPETIRLYDVLEQGCIPIMLRADFLSAPSALGGDVPFPVLESWRDLPALLAPYADLADPRAAAAAEGLRQACLAWWGDFKNRKSTEIGETVDAAFAATPPLPPL